MKPMLTIFTPTYNRAYILGRCYESMKKQTCKEFIWLIIDDGSSDNTKELVESWISQGIVSIRYHYQENQGMHGAHNTAYELIDTELNVCIDSDDYMPIDAVEKIIGCWKKYGNKIVSGIAGLDSFTNGKVIGTRLPEGVKASTLFDLYNKHGVLGDKKLVYRSELTKEYPYPLFPGEKYVNLGYKYAMLDKDYQLLLMNEVLCYVEYMLDGSSKNMLRQYLKNPRGFAFWRKEALMLPFGSLYYKFKQAVHYVSSSLISRNRTFLEESPRRLLTILAIPLGVLLYFYIILKTSKGMNDIQLKEKAVK